MDINNNRASFTPICDFVESYKNSSPVRAHMPGHKGINFLGFEGYDITEIDGADSLFEANGIIKESENIASELFSTAHTFFSCEGSSLSIKAMLYLGLLASKEKDKDAYPLIFAARNAHKAFICGCSLLSIDVHWLYGENNQDSHLSCKINPKALDYELSNAKVKPFAVYVTSPDYLGDIADIKGLSKVCKKHDVLLMVDNAHGAYLKFLKNSMHPMDLGADICCDSAHKTLPCLTGGAYLHISKNAPERLLSKACFAKDAMALFGSTSPSYLILQSIDKANEYIAKHIEKDLLDSVSNMDKLKCNLRVKGYKLLGSEPMKITIDAKDYGYYGSMLAEILKGNNIFCEFYDSDYLVLMTSMQNTCRELEIIENALLSIERKPRINEKPPKSVVCEKVLTPKEAILYESEILPIDECEGRILSQTSVSCPPAVPIAVMGERLNKDAIEAFKYYSINECKVIK